MTDLDQLVHELYVRREETWANARHNAETFVKQAVRLADADDRYLYSVTSRIKRKERALDKVRRKIANGKIATPSEIEGAEGAISDWVGVKVACNTAADAKSLISILEQNCRKEGYPQFAAKPDGTDDIEDYVNEPKGSGYRAYHAVVTVHGFDKAKACDVKAEIQIKTRLQDAWGELTHETFYKSGDHERPEFYDQLAKTMADLLATVDDHATHLAKAVADEAEAFAEGESAASGDEEEQHDLREGQPTSEVVTVFHLDPRYALARSANGDVGLIRAIWVRDLLVGSGEIDQDRLIDMDDFLVDGQELLATRYEEDDRMFFEPITLADPADMEPDFDDRDRQLNR